MWVGTGMPWNHRFGQKSGIEIGGYREVLAPLLMLSGLPMAILANKGPHASLVGVYQAEM